MDIIMTGYVALGGISFILDNYEEKLNRELPLSLIKSAKKIVSASDEIKRVQESVWKIEPDAIIYEAGDGGIYKALWDITCTHDISGLVTYLKDMMIKQEFIEISECFNINPYMLNAKGVYIVVAQYGNSICRQLQADGIECALIGYTTQNNDKIVVNDDEIRYIDSRIKDELTKLEGLKDERKDS